MPADHKSSRFDSEFFDNVQELSEAREDASRDAAKRKKRLDKVRKFSNGMATLTEQEAKELGRTEIVNHLTTYSKLQQQEASFKSMATGTKNLIEIIVDTNNPEEDHLTGQRLSQAINRGAIHRKGKFPSLWRKVSGEVVISGGVPVVTPPRYGWLPRIAVDMIFPKDAELDADLIPYAWEPRELSYADLKKMLASIKGDKGKVYDRDNLEELIEMLKTQTKDRFKENSGFGENEITKGTREDRNDRNFATVEAWAYYEVKWRDNGESYVSETLFVDGVNTQAGQEQSQRMRDGDREEDTSSARVISYIEEAYKDAFEWLTIVAVDAEIGGEKTFDTLRGVAELVYPSGMEMEELLNLLLEGDKIRARPKLKITNSAKVEDIASWDIEQDLFAPDGVEPMDFKSNAQHLLTPISFLDQNASSVTGAPVTNGPGGGELRVQQQERLQSNQNVQVDRLSEAYNHMETIAETMVYRLLRGPTKPGTEGYLETQWVRKKLEEEGIDYKALSERENGQFKFLRIRVKRSIGNGDRQQQIETSDWLMKQALNFEPATRPIIIREAVSLRTQDPDLAEAAVRVPEVILNSQRVISENEFDTILRRASLGETIPTQPDDVHQLHIPTHLKDAQAMLASHQRRPWDMEAAIGFAGAMEHTQQHIGILMSNPETNFEGTQFLQQFQALVNASRPILADVEEREGNEANQLTPKEQADIEIKIAELELQARKLGLQEEDMRDLRNIRASRQALSERNQFTREIDSSRRFALEKEKLDTQKPAPQTSDQ